MLSFLPGCCHPLGYSHPYPNMSLLNHPNIIGPVANGQGDGGWLGVLPYQPHKKRLLLWTNTAGNDGISGACHSEEHLFVTRIAKEVCQGSAFDHEGTGGTQTVGCRIVITPGLSRRAKIFPQMLP